MAIVPLLLRGLRAFGSRRLLVFKSWRRRDKILGVFVFVKQRSNQIQNPSSYEVTLYKILISIKLIKHYLKNIILPAFQERPEGSKNRLQ